MPTLEEELRAVMERVSTLDTAPQVPPVDRRAEVGARVRRRRRARAAASAAALVVVLAAGAAVTGWPWRDLTTPVSTRPPAPSELTDNVTTLVSETIVMPTGTGMTVDFKPTSWSLVLEVSCLAPATKHLSISLNDHFVEELPCEPASASNDGKSDSGFDEQFWKAHGIRLGQWSTIAATVVDDNYATPHFDIGTSGLATVDLYQAAGG